MRMNEFLRGATVIPRVVTCPTFSGVLKLRKSLVCGDFMASAGVTARNSSI
jgi:hypothetical protein